MAALDSPSRPVTRAAARAAATSVDGSGAEPNLDPKTTGGVLNSGRQVDDALRRARRRLAPSEARALLRLTLLMAVLWMLAIALGAALNDGRPPVRHKLPLIWFDRILRSIGPLLPVGVLLLRWYATLPPPGASAADSPQFGELAALYAAVAAGRAALYALHLSLAPLIVAAKGEGGHAHLLSDHIFLGASLVATFSAEAHLIAADVRRCWAGRARVDQIALTAAALLLAVLFALTCTEMHITARHFHAPTESLWAVATGLLFFQAPVLFFMHSITN